MKLLVLTIVLLSASWLPVLAQDGPQLRRQGTATQLIVEGKPFLMLGGELGNSTSSSLEYMQPLWAKFEAMHLNTILVPVYWELLEPEEGKFDFTLVDGIIAEARKRNIRIVPLWFGSWKNSQSCYVPAWVKTNQKRFPRAQTSDGQGIEILSPFDAENWRTDAKAFAAFMRHLKETDSRQQTVILVQVENEIGMIPEARDHSPTAEKLFQEAVPAELMNYLSSRKDTLQQELREQWGRRGFNTQGNWEQIFGRGPATDELFSAWYFARYTEQVTTAGKREYALPMYANAALIRPGYYPGQYPSAGPLPHLQDIWRAGAPALDFLAPDIYFPNFIEWTRKYFRAGNPLFVPEVGVTPMTPYQAFYAFGAFDAMGFSPFAIESLENPADTQLAASYATLRELTPLITQFQGRGALAGMLPEAAEQRVPQQFRLGGYVLNVTYERQGAAATTPPTTTPPAGGLALAVGPDEFYIAGSGLVVTFDPDSPGDPIVGILSAQEGHFVDGKWRGGRWLNGDQTHQGRHIRLPSGAFGIQHVRLYRYR